LARGLQELFGLDAQNALTSFMTCLPQDASGRSAGFSRIRMSLDLTSLLTTPTGTATGLSGGAVASEGKGGEQTSAVSFENLLTALTGEATVAAPVQDAQLPQVTTPQVQAPQVQANTDAAATLMAAQTVAQTIDASQTIDTNAVQPTVTQAPVAPQVKVLATVVAPVVTEAEPLPQVVVAAPVAHPQTPAVESANVTVATPVVDAPVQPEILPAAATQTEILPVTAPKAETTQALKAVEKQAAAPVQTPVLNAPHDIVVTAATPVVIEAPVVQPQTTAVETSAATEVEAAVVQPIVVQQTLAKPVKATKTTDVATPDTKAVAEKTTDDTVASEVMASLVAQVPQAPVATPVAAPVQIASQQANSPAPVAPQAPQDQAANPPVDDQSAPQAKLPTDAASATAKAADFASLLTATDQKTAAAPTTSAPVAAAPVSAKAPEAQSQQAQTPVQETAAPQVRSVQAQAPVKPQAQTQTAIATASVESAVVATPVAASDTSSAFTLISAQAQGQSTYTSDLKAETVAPQTAMSQTAIENLNALSVQINKRHAEGATKFTMELHPADLGRVDVALTIAKDGKLTAHMTFDSAVTAETFSAHEADLRKQLSATGLALADDALTFTSRAKPEATVVAAQSQTSTGNQNPNGQPTQQDARAQDSLSQQNSNSQQNQQQQQALLNDQQGQNRHNAQQAARALAQAGQAANDIDMDATLDAAMASLKYRQPHSSLALNLIV
jgi:hypothetical protein